MNVALLTLFLGMSPAQTTEGEGALAQDAVALGMSREGSGTAWQPDSTPMFMHHFMVGEWMVMLHYNGGIGFDDQTGPRGGRQFISTNWEMLMAQHDLAGGLFAARLMLSLEPLTTGGAAGYPLLLQTGETANGLALHDRQHPHDLFMEVAAKYSHPLGSLLGVQLYLAPSGEPALGPVAFPHRTSAMYDPIAAISHHWQDSTHVSFGVATFGLFTRTWKLEGSWFNGREPDENRYDFDFRAFDSYAVRLSFNPDADTSFQVSYGYLNSPEALTPGQSVQRLTASATWNVPWGDEGNWATTAVFGRNIPSAEGPSNSLLLESSLERGLNVFFGRLEYVQKTGADLVVVGQGSTLFPLGVVSLGYLRHFGALCHVVPGLGVRGAVNLIPGSLSDSYGGTTPLSAMVFLHLRPERME